MLRAVDGGAPVAVVALGIALLVLGSGLVRRATDRGGQDPRADGAAGGGGGGPALRTALLGVAGHVAGTVAVRGGAPLAVLILATAAGLAVAARPWRRTPGAGPRRPRPGAARLAAAGSGALLLALVAGGVDAILAAVGGAPALLPDIAHVVVVPLHAGVVDPPALAAGAAAAVALALTERRLAGAGAVARWTPFLLLLGPARPAQAAAVAWLASRLDGAAAGPAVRAGLILLVVVLPLAAGLLGA